MRNCKKAIVQGVPPEANKPLQEFAHYLIVYSHSIVQKAIALTKRSNSKEKSAKYGCIRYGQCRSSPSVQHLGWHIFLSLMKIFCGETWFINTNISGNQPLVYYTHTVHNVPTCVDLHWLTCTLTLIELNFVHRLMQVFHCLDTQCMLTQVDRKSTVYWMVMNHWLVTWLWRWLLLRQSKRQSPTTVFLKTIPSPRRSP